MYFPCTILKKLFVQKDNLVSSKNIQAVQLHLKHRQ